MGGCGIGFDYDAWFGLLGVILFVVGLIVAVCLVCSYWFALFWDVAPALIDDLRFGRLCASGFEVVAYWC